MSSVRFICGTQDIHKELEKTIADFHQTEDTILYAAAFDANGGVFEPLLTAEDAIISDSLNHASIIDGVRLCKAARYRYANNDMADLEQQLQAANEGGHRFKIIVTDGVFSMDGYVAQIDRICDLADQYDALVMVDECHATGFIGKQAGLVGAHASGWTSSPVRLARLWAAPWAGSPPDGPKSSRCCASEAGLTSLATPSRPASSGPAWKSSGCWTKPRNCATGWKTTPTTSKRGFVASDSNSKTAKAPSSPSCWAMPD